MQCTQLATIVASLRLTLLSGYRTDALFCLPTRFDHDTALRTTSILILDRHTNRAVSEYTVNPVCCRCRLVPIPSTSIVCSEACKVITELFRG